MKTAASTKESCPGDVLGSPHATAWSLCTCQSTWQEHSWALQSLGSVRALQKDLCNQSNSIPSGLNLCVEKPVVFSVFKPVFKPQTIWRRRHPLHISLRKTYASILISILRHWKDTQLKSRGSCFCLMKFSFRHGSIKNNQVF